MRSIALHAMQSGNSIDSPYAHSYMDGLLGLIEGCRSGKSDPGETLEHIMIDMVSFQRFLDMRLTVLEKAGSADRLVIGAALRLFTCRAGSFG